MKTVFTEISVPGGIKIGLQKAITSASMVPLKWAAAAKYMTCLNEQADLTRPIKGNKPRVFKLIITLGSDTDITNTVEENAVDMA